MAAARWQGRGDKNAVDQAAVDAMRAHLATLDIDGIVVIGEGEKDNAPMLYNGERVGNGSDPEVDVAVDPVDGTRLTAVGQPGALAVLAVAERGTMYAPGKLVYMDKIAVGPEAAGSIALDAPVDHNLARWPRRGARTSTTSRQSSSTGPATSATWSGAGGRRPHPPDPRRRRLGRRSPPPARRATSTSSSASAARRRR